MFEIHNPAIFTHLELINIYNFGNLTKTMYVHFNLITNFRRDMERAEKVHIEKSKRFFFFTITL